MKSSQKKILVDTNVFVGYYNKEDALHERATKILLKADQFLTTEQTFVEIINVFSRRAGYTAAQEAGQELLDRDITILQPLQHEFDRAWELFSSQSKLSFTDCINIVLAETTGCDGIATFDEEYRTSSKTEILMR